MYECMAVEGILMIFVRRVGGWKPGMAWSKLTDGSVWSVSVTQGLQGLLFLRHRGKNVELACVSRQEKHLFWDKLHKI